MLHRISPNPARRNMDGLVVWRANNRTYTNITHGRTKDETQLPAGHKLPTIESEPGVWCVERPSSGESAGGEWMARRSGPAVGQGALWGCGEERYMVGKLCGAVSPRAAGRARPGDPIRRSAAYPWGTSIGMRGMARSDPYAILPGHLLFVAAEEAAEETADPFYQVRDGLRLRQRFGRAPLSTASHLLHALANVLAFLDRLNLSDCCMVLRRVPVRPLLGISHLRFTRQLRVHREPVCWLFLLLLLRLGSRCGFLLFLGDGRWLLRRGRIRCR